jgi:hypothetical protein
MIIKKRTTKDKRILFFGDSFCYGHGCSDRVHYIDSDGNTVGDPDVLHEPPSKFCYASLLEKDNPSWEIINHSIPGNDNLSMFIRLMREITDNNKLDYVVWNSSFDDRIVVRNPHSTEPLFSWPEFGFKKPVDNIFGHDAPMPVGVATIPENKPLEGEHHYYHKQALVMYRNELFTHRGSNSTSLSLLYAMYAVTLTNNIPFLWSTHTNASLSTHGYPPPKEYVSAPIRDLEIPGIQKASVLLDNKRGNINAIQENLSPDGHASDAGHKMYYDKVIGPIFNNLK